MSINHTTTDEQDMALAIELLEKLGQKAKAYAARSDVHDAIFTDLAEYIDKSVHALVSRNPNEL